MELDSLRSELDKYRTENTELVQELSAVNHHRTVLRDTLDQLDREVRERVDLLSDLQASTRHHTSPHGKGRQGLDETALGVMGDVEEGLHRQVLRYKARAKAFEELSTIYRTSVLALYADGASYGAAQFGWQPHSGAGASGEFSTKPHHIQLIGTSFALSLSFYIAVLHSVIAEMRSYRSCKVYYILSFIFVSQVLDGLNVR